jgi:hypothetical protein
MAFLTQNKAKLCKNLLMTLVFEKNANFFAEICRKLQKIVIITLTSNFRPLGNCFLWAVFFNCKSSPQIWVLFPRLRLGINFDKKIVGLHFGRIFHKLIWSHVPLPRYSPRRIILDSLWKERGTKMVNFQAGGGRCYDFVNISDTGDNIGDFDLKHVCVCTASHTYSIEHSCM